MTLFVTGATSSIGQVLVRKLGGDNEKVKVLVRKSSNLKALNFPSVQFVYGDVTDYETVLEGMQGCESVVHMAAIVGHNVPEETWWKVNRDGSRNVLKAAKETGVQSMVQVSTISVLGPTQPGETADENHLVDPGQYFNLYQKTKRAADDIARQFAEDGLRVMIVYPCFGYGFSSASSHPSMHETTLLRMASGKPVAIFGNGQNRLSVSYYDDTVQGILLVMQKGQSGEGYILNGDCLTFNQIWIEIARAIGKKPPTRHIPIELLKFGNAAYSLFRGKPLFPGDFFEMIGYDWCYSSEKAQSSLGWQPTRFHEGIQLTWAAYQQNGWKPK
jgi:farnesol dehydrogenase